jgi:hypothetical protein
MGKEVSTKKESFTQLGPVQSEISFIDEMEDKDINKLYNSLSKRQKKVFDLLCTGKQSVTDITIKLGYSDPRSHIKRIIDKGIIINSKWIEKGEIRYKLYWAESDKRSCEALPIGEILESTDFNKINYGR